MGHRATVVRHYGNNSISGRADFGTRQYDLATEAARSGSAALKERMESVIFKFGWRHRITTEEARHLLLNTGVRL
jgi:hypothetical protein